MTTRSENKPAKVSRQEEQARLMEQARRSPGVADALRLFERLNMHDPTAQAIPVQRYATGGNS